MPKREHENWRCISDGFGIQEILHQRMGKGGIREQQRAVGIVCKPTPRESIVEVKRIERRSLDSKIFK